MEGEPPPPTMMKTSAIATTNAKWIRSASQPEDDVANRRIRRTIRGISRTNRNIEHNLSNS